MEKKLTFYIRRVFNLSHKVSLTFILSFGCWLDSRNVDKIKVALFDENEKQMTLACVRIIVTKNMKCL